MARLWRLPDPPVLLHLPSTTANSTCTMLGLPRASSRLSAACCLLVLPSFSQVRGLVVGPGPLLWLHFESFSGVRSSHSSSPGNERMQERPIGDLVDALASCLSGVQFTYVKDVGCLPLCIQIQRSEHSSSQKSVLAARDGNNEQKQKQKKIRVETYTYSTRERERERDGNWNFSSLLCDGM